MRTYEPNSPEALARIVALTMLADGHLSQSEHAMLDKLGAHEQLGLSREAMGIVVQDLCLDLLSTSHAHWSGAARVDAHTLSALLLEVTLPNLQQTVLSVCEAVAQADPHTCEDESPILLAALKQWRPAKTAPTQPPVRRDQHALAAASRT